MKTRSFSLLYAYPLLVAMPMAARADISLPGAAPAPQPSATPASTAPAVYHSELLASNAVHAVFKGLRMLPVVKLEEAPSVEEVAVFEVKQNLAHRRYDRMGDGALQVGKLFSVSLASDVPGQDAALGGQIRQMQPGDEALMNIDHIYVFRESGNENVRPCTRFTRVQPRQPEAQPAPTPATPVTPAAPAAESPTMAPLPAAVPAAPAATPAATQPVQPVQRNFSYRSSRSVVSRTVIEPDGQGGMKRTHVEEQREWVPELNQERVRKFINGVEVDPQTDQPLPTPSAPAAPQPEAPQPPTAPAQEAPIPDPIPNNS